VIPENLRLGGGVSDTIFNPVVALIIVLAGVLMIILPQRKAIVPFLLTSILIPGDQILVVAGLHFPVMRILIVFGMLRIFIIRGPGEWSVFSGGLNRIDKLLILFSLVSAAAGVLLFRNGQAILFELGRLYSAFGVYFLLRCVIRNHEDVVRVIRALAFIVIALSVVMISERITHHNPYALLGGAKAAYFATDLARDGRVRATGSFGTPILAGVFGAVTLPLFIGLWLSDQKRRGVAIVGMFGATVMVITSNSSTPAIAYLAGLMGICLWPLRRTMGIIRWGIAGLLVCLQLVMKGPVWHLITRVGSSGSSYHRYALINNCIRHIGEWWLVGTRNNASWGWDMWDTANQYVSNAVNGGLLSLILFIAILVYGFRYLGNARRAATDKNQALFFWSLAVALFVHVISFFGISYWDQSIVGWYAMLAFISATAVPKKVSAPLPQFRGGLALATESRAIAPANQLVSRWR
jgi:hypothetical protein